MTRQLRLLVVVAWIVSLAGAGAWADARVRAATDVPQSFPAPPVTLRRVVPQGAVPPAPVVYAGDDLGFRIDSEIGGVKRGTLVIRVDGEWVEAQFAAKVRPVK